MTYIMSIHDFLELHYKLWVIDGIRGGERKILQKVSRIFYGQHCWQLRDLDRFYYVWIRDIPKGVGQPRTLVVRYFKDKYIMFRLRNP